MAKYKNSGKKWISECDIAYTYSENVHGKYAKILAELSEKYNCKFVHYIEILEDYAVIHNYSKTYGYHDILIDKDDVDKVKDIRWTTKLDPSSGAYYTRNKEYGSIHRYILGLSSNDKRQVDHINRDPRDNRKSNLRIVNSSTNSRNRKNRKDSKYPVRGVTYNERDDMFYARIKTDNGTERAYFSCKKYGYNEAERLAIQWRRDKEKNNNYK